MWILYMSGSKNDENLFQRLKDLGIKAHTVEHAPLHTVEESKALRGELDGGLLAADVINAHPLRNDRTTAIAAKDLLAFLKAENHDPILIDFSKPFAINEN